MGEQRMRLVSKTVGKEILEALRMRYPQALRPEKTRILGEFVQISGDHRKHGIRLLNSNLKMKVQGTSARRIDNEAVKTSLILIWETADRIWGKRLKAVMHPLISAMEKRGPLEWDTEVREKRLSMSPATIDR